ncbi:MAG: class I SAM-dependent methyltransferase [Lachnospiraceae bacterium]|nr:class I SAM-dependent methyltransferase [Lachnospiraceae bacterium]MCI9134345.1 class I SAM-dependent methyltransferase [Lachnospiraceae bacterium]
MEAYTGFAAVYDEFMDNIPYGEWSRYVIRLLRAQGIREGLVLELGCGTGSMTELLAAAGYDMIGLDCSQEMLELAAEKRAASGQNILYLLQDMRELELYGTVGAVVSVCDSMNYILEEQELLQVFRLVNNYLDPGGIFLFDLNTAYKYETVLGECTIAENREECSFIWENYYDKDAKINEYDLTLFLREECGLYRRFQETHYQRAYSLDTIGKLLEQAGMEFLAIYEAFTEEAPGPKSERVYVLARERGKSEK